MKKAIIVSCFDNYGYEVRTKYIEQCLKEKGYDCEIVASDFDHRKKEKYVCNRRGLTLLHVPEYKKNISFSRIYSHIIFARTAMKYIKKIKPQLVLVGTPPNFLFYFIRKYKRRNKDCKLIFQIGDMWPETLPVSENVKKIVSPVLWCWKLVRNANIACADGIIYECDLFRDYLKRYTKQIKAETIYLCKENRLEHARIERERVAKFEDELHILYLGSINNIIDCELIVRLLGELNKKKSCCLEIIGDGEKRDSLIKKCMDKGVKVKFHGAIFDDNDKWQVIKECHFALNIMKENVFVGMTMKSLEYFYFGLPLLNTIQGDTHKMVDDENCGININRFYIGKTVDKILKNDEYRWKEMCLNSRNMYLKHFDTKIIVSQLSNFIQKVACDNL